MHLIVMSCIAYFQILNRSIDSIVRRPYSLNDGGSLIIKFKDLKHFKIDINGGEEFSNVADSLEKLSAVGKKNHFELAYLPVYLNNYFNFHFCLSIHSFVRVSENQLQFLQSLHKMSLLKVAWHVLRVKSVHSGSPSDLLWGP